MKLSMLISEGVLEEGQCMVRVHIEPRTASIAYIVFLFSSVFPFFLVAQNETSSWPEPELEN